MKNFLLVCGVLLGVSGCATWSTSETKMLNNNFEIKPTVATSVKVFEGNIADKKYLVIADISVEVNKTTVFHPDPTREMVNEKLKEEAAKLGADAVIYVRYGTVGWGAFSYGSLNGRGRAIRFAE